MKTVQDCSHRSLPTACTRLLLANFGNEGKPELTIAKSPQETRAEMICTTRSHVILFMDKFLKLGSIDYIRGIEIRGSLLNVDLHEQLEIHDHAEH